MGPGLAIDSNRYFVVCVNSLGSCFGSTGPASINPATGTAYRLSFPDLSVEDIARAGYETLRSLEIERADTVIGPSLGGMVVLAYAAQFPGAARRIVSISGSAAASPFAIALRSIQREAILRDPDWRGGAYTDEQPPATGMRIARKLGMMTYRSAHEWRERFGRQPANEQSPQDGPFAPEFAIQSYLEAHARRFVRAFDPNCYLYISRAMDRFDLAAHGGSHVAALARSRVETALVIGVESDMLFAIGEQEKLAKSFEEAGVDDVVRAARLHRRPRFVPDRHRALRVGNPHVPESRLAAALRRRSQQRQRTMKERAHRAQQLRLRLTHHLIGGYRLDEPVDQSLLCKRLQLLQAR